MRNGGLVKPQPAPFSRRVVFLGFAMQINHRVDAFWAWLWDAKEYVIPAHLRVWPPGQLHICFGSRPGSVQFPDILAFWLSDFLAFWLYWPGPVRAQVLQFPVSYVVLALSSAYGRAIIPQFIIIVSLAMFALVFPLMKGFRSFSLAAPLMYWQVK